MPRSHTVRPGECLVTIARQYGFLDFKTIYEHTDNADLRRIRPNPNILHPGDEVFIPDLTSKTVRLPTGQSHKFTVKSAKKELALTLLDHAGEPIGGEPYELQVEGEPARTGKQTDGEGKLKESIPAGKTKAVLTIRGRALELRLGHINPLRDVPDDDISGVQGRLKNLGYHVAAADGAHKPASAAAIALFQADEDVDVTGELDDATLAKLEERHGC